MKNCWRTDSTKTSYLDTGVKYIAVRINDYRIMFFPYPKFQGNAIREKLAQEVSA